MKFDYSIQLKSLETLIRRSYCDGCLMWLDRPRWFSNGTLVFQIMNCCGTTLLFSTDVSCSHNCILISEYDVWMGIIISNGLMQFHRLTCAQPCSEFECFCSVPCLHDYRLMTSHLYILRQLRHVGQLGFISIRYAIKAISGLLRCCYAPSSFTKSSNSGV